MRTASILSKLALILSEVIIFLQYWPLKLINCVVNMILVVGHDKLHVEMQRTYGSLLSVVKVPKSGGVSILLSIPIVDSNFYI